jgi:hypothetical protein
MIQAHAGEMDKGVVVAQKLVAGELVEAAQRATGLQRFDSESFREGIDVLLADANKVYYSEMGLERFRAAIIGALSTRLKGTAYLEQRPNARSLRVRILEPTA